MARKKDNIVRYTVEELRSVPSRTDWERARKTTQAEVEAQIAEDPDDWIADTGGIMMSGFPPRATKERVNIRLDRDVIDFFRASGPGYQTRINEVLKVFVRRKREPVKARGRKQG